MHVRPVVAAAVILALWCVLPVSQAAGATGSERDMAGMINAERGSRGLARLTLDADLSSIARAHSRRMADAGGVWHSTQLHSLVSGRLVGENVGMGFDVGGLHTALMRSPSHRENILEPAYRRVGIGLVSADGFLYVTQIFVAPYASSPAQPTTTKPERRPRVSGVRAPDTIATVEAKALPAHTERTRSPARRRPSPAPAKPDTRVVRILLRMVTQDAAPGGTT